MFYKDKHYNLRVNVFTYKHDYLQDKLKLCIQMLNDLKM